MTATDDTPWVTPRQKALDTASGLIHGPRTSYGPPKVNFQRIADRWSHILHTNVEPWQVCVMMADLKISRLCEGYQEDSVHDLIGYAALAAEVAKE